jgi:hypothetical protein
MNNRYRIVIFLLTFLAIILLVWLYRPSPFFETLQTAHNITGNQAHSGVGVQFIVNSEIDVLALGIYDSDQNGIAAPQNAPLSAYLLNSKGVTMAQMTFDSTSQGTLDPASKYRFKPLTPAVSLPPGTYVLAGYGWTSRDLEHNCDLSNNTGCDTFNTGGGLLTYVASPYGGGSDPPGTLPTHQCCGNLNFYSAANMRFKKR